MSTYNGELYIRQQIDSILKQEGVRVSLLVRDDGSEDKTVQILQEYQKHGLLRFYQGNNVGPGFSFLDLMKHAPASEYYAFADQDDFWISDKLAIAISKIKKNPQDTYKMYCGRPRIVDEKLNPLDKDSDRNHMYIPKTFEQKLIYRGIVGCTVVFNNSLLKLVNDHHVNYLEMHDCWLYQTCIINGGAVIYDKDVHILYRQHGNNVIGAGNNRKKVWKKNINRLIKGKHERSQTAEELIRIYRNQLKPIQLNSLRLLAHYRKNIFARIKLLNSNKFKTGISHDDRHFKIAILFGMY